MDPDDRPRSTDDDAVERTNGPPENSGPHDDESVDNEPASDDGPVSDEEPIADESVEGERLKGTSPERGRSVGEQRAGGDKRSDTDGEGSDRVKIEPETLWHRFRHDNDGPLMWIREMLSSVAIVLLIGLLLFGISGVWPPMVAVESGSMEPNMEVGDLVVVTEPGRFAPDAADNEIGVVTYEAGEAADYRTFGTYGSVIIFQPPDRTASPIIHRPMFHVEAGENWYDRADEQYHRADDCDELRHCPAPHDGYITLGDNNREYDQANGLAEPVKADWVTGVARVRIPYLGYVRLLATGQVELGDLLSTSTGIGFANGGGDPVRLEASVTP